MSGAIWFRVLIGAVWLGAGLEKLLNPEFPVLFDQVLKAGAFSQDGPAWFNAFMNGYVIPDPDLFALLVGAGETVVGAGLILGALTNLCAIGGIFFGLVFFTALGGPGIGTGLGSPGILTLQLIMALSSLILLVSPDAKATSIDRLIATRIPCLSRLLLNVREPSGIEERRWGGMTGMTLVRLLLGAIWLNGGLEKLLNPGFPRLFDAVLQTGGYIDQGPPVFEALMNRFVVPNAELFAVSACLGETAIGVGLILGLFTNFNAMGSIFMNLMLQTSLGGLAIGTGLGAPGLLPLHILLALAALIVLLSPNAKAVSVDRLLALRSPRLAPVLLLKSIKGLHSEEGRTRQAA